MVQTRVPSVSRIVMVVLGLWLAVAVVTNIIDLASTIRGGYPLRGSSGNLLMMAQLIGVYFVPPFWLLEVLLAGVIVVEGAAAAFFLMNRATIAFALSVSLFGGFIVVDDIFLGYSIEASHRMIFIMLCVAYLVVRTASRAQAEP